MYFEKRSADGKKMFYKSNQPGNGYYARCMYVFTGNDG